MCGSVAPTHRRLTLLLGTMKKSNMKCELFAAGWQYTGDDFWIATPGTAPGGPWTTKSAFRYLALGNTFRALAALGWNVPGEYVGNCDVVTAGPYVAHPEKAPRFITVRRALKIEHLRADSLGRLVAASLA